MVTLLLWFATVEGSIDGEISYKSTVTLSAQRGVRGVETIPLHHSWWKYEFTGFNWSMVNMFPRRNSSVTTSETQNFQISFSRQSYNCLSMMFNFASPRWTFFVCLFLRSAFLRKHQTLQGCGSSGVALFVSTTAMHAADDGISLLTVQSVQHQVPLTVWSTWYMEMARKRTYTVYVTLKESVRKSARVLFAWDSGSVIVLDTDLLMPTQAGTQCPGYTWKKYLPHRLNKSKATVFVLLWTIIMSRVIFRW